MLSAATQHERKLQENDVPIETTLTVEEDESFEFTTADPIVNVEEVESEPEDHVSSTNVDNNDEWLGINQKLLEREATLRQINSKLQHKTRAAVREAEKAVSTSKSALSEPLPKPAPVELQPLGDVKKPQQKCKPMMDVGQSNVVVSGREGDEAAEEAEEAGMSSEATVRFLRAKLNVALERVSELNKVVQEDETRLRQAEGQMTALQDENAKLHKSSAMIQSQLEKQRKMTQDGRTRNEGLETELQSVRKELEKLERQKKQTDLDANAREIRLNRALEELQKYKAQTAATQTKKDELLSGACQETNHLKQEVKRLEKQKQELVTAFKKQMQLIDVLKRQKLHLEAVHLLHFSEEEFMKCLDWKTESA